MLGRWWERIPRSASTSSEKVLGASYVTFRSFEPAGRIRHLPQGVARWLEYDGDICICRKVWQGG